jgi:hypothetical protein
MKKKDPDDQMIMREVYLELYDQIAGVKILSVFWYKNSFILGYYLL